MENRPHVLRGNDNLNMQKDFIFFDTETFKNKRGGVSELSLRLGWAMYWHRPTDRREWFFFESAGDFWNWVDGMKIKDIIMYAHNTGFDMKITRGYDIMTLEKGYKVTRFYVKDAVYILEFTKKDMIGERLKTRKIRIYDTMNYVRMTLEKLGESIGVSKTSLKDWDWVDERGQRQPGVTNPNLPYGILKDYCRADVEVIAEYIRQLTAFLEMNQLSKLKPTIASLCFNIYRHRFYDSFERPFHIHAHDRAIALERESYKGGIADCFRVGVIPGMSMLLDINSMYPTVMLRNDVPTRLVIYSEEPWIEAAAHRNLDAYMQGKKHLLGIAEAEIELPEDAAYILTRFKVGGTVKCGFIKGRYLATLTWPELAFVKEHGTVHSIRKLALYEHHNMFREYVEFMYGKREEYAKSNPAFSMMAKSMLTNLYGKFGQKACKYKKLKEYAKEYPGFEDTMLYDSLLREEKGIGHRCSSSSDWPHEVNSLRFGGSLVIVDETSRNSFESFVAVASYVTAYARMMLTGMIRQAGREHVYYSDTDSMIMSVEGERNIAHHIDYVSKELGKLKVEGYARDITIYRPKFYHFGKKFKCKGMRKNARIISDTHDELKVSQEQFEGFGGSMRNGNMGVQIIRDIEKTMGKTYDKGHVVDGRVIPFDFTDLQPRHSPIRQARLKVDEDLIDRKALTDSSLTESENRDNMRVQMREFIKI